MRILHISTRLILGGSQENTVLSCEGQALRGHEVHLAFGPIYGPEGSLLERVEAFRAPASPGDSDVNPRRITTHVLPHMVRELAPAKDRLAYRECRALIRRLKPDVVHTHSSKAGILGRAAAWRERVPAVVHTIHGLPFHPYEKPWRNALYVLSERWAAKRCHVIVTVCDAMRDQALAKGVGKPNQYATVYSGMEVEAFLNPGISREEVRTRLGLAPEDFVIGTVARLAELKGHDDLLDALAEPMRAHANWKMLWVGDGWWRDRLLGRVREMGLTNQVVATGLVPPEEVPGLMRAMDVLAHPSYREGLPRTVPQALLSGVPAIAYDVDGAPEACLEGRTGLLVPPGDRPALRAAVEWMAAHPNERAAMAAEGREFCRERFSVEKMIDDLEAVYARALGR